MVTNQKERKYQYPDETAPDHIKDSPEFGLTVGRYIYNEAFAGDDNYYAQRDKMLKVASHLKGDIDIDYFSDLLGIDADASSLALNWEPPRILSKYINIVSDGLNDDIYRIKAKGIDEISNRDRQLFTNNMKNAMALKPFNREFNRMFGESTQMQYGMPESEIPETSEELDLLTQMTYKQKREIASEMAVKKVLRFNNINDESRHKVNEWMTAHGIAGYRLYRYGGSLKIRLVNPLRFTCAKDNTSNNDKRDTPWFAEPVDVTVGELKKIAHEYGTELTDNELITLSGGNPSKSRWNEDKSNEIDDDHTVTVLDFAVKMINHVTRKRVVSKKHGGVSMIRKNSNWDKGKYSDSEKIQKPYDVWYEGIYVDGLDRMIGWRKVCDMPRVKSDLSKTYPPFQIYELSTESLGRRIVTYAEQIYVIYLKIQILVQKLKPKGIAIDISRLADLEIEGNDMSAWDVITMFNEEGNLLWTSKTDDDTTDKTPPVYELPGSDGREFTALMNLYEHYIQKIREDTGVNEARDATSPNPEVAVGTTQQALANSLNATEHIRRGVINLYRNLCQAILAHVQHMVMSGHESKMLRELIGEFSFDVMEAYLKLYENDFDIAIELKLTDEQRARIGEYIKIALQQQQISVVDASEIEMIENYSVALALLKVKIDKYMKNKAASDQMLAQVEMSKEESKRRSEMEKIQIKLDLELRNETEKAKLEIEKALAIKRGELELMRQYGSGKVQDAAAIEGIKHEHRIAENEMKDKNKKTLVDKQSTQQSKLIDQREKKSGPKDFENESIIDSIINREKQVENIE